MRHALVALAAIALILGLQTFGRADAPVGVQKWEFKVVMSSGETGLDLANEAGKEGWELVAVRDGWLFMKRPLK